MTGLLVFAFLALALAGYLVALFNGLVRVRAAVKLGWSSGTMSCRSWSKCAGNTCSTRRQLSSVSCVRGRGSMRHAAQVT